MKKNIFLLSIILFLITACNNDEAEINTGTDNQENQVTFTTRGHATDGVSVLIFREDKQKTDYYYQEEFKPIWQTVGTSQAQAQKALLLGNYQFLFYRWDDDGNTTMTVPQTGKTTIENIRFNAKPDVKTNYVLPVDPVWLPVDATDAKEKYEFTGINNKTVSEKLRRAVSLVEVKLRRGYKNDPSDPEYTPQPYSIGKSVMDHFDKITLDIKKVGTSVGVNGNYGAAGTYVSDIAGETLIDDPVKGNQGFAFFFWRTTRVSQRKRAGLRNNDHPYTKSGSQKSIQRKKQ